MKLAITLTACTALALAACSSGSDPSPTASTSSACDVVNQMEEPVSALTGTNADNLTMTEASKDLASLNTSLTELMGVADNLALTTAEELEATLFIYQTEISQVSADDPISDSQTGSPSPSPALSSVQSDLASQFADVRKQLGC